MEEVARGAGANFGFLPTVAALSSDGDGSSLLGYKQHARLWRQVASLGLSKGAPTSVSQMDDVARQVCPYTGGDTPMDGVGATTASEILRKYPPPHAVASTSHEAARFLQFKRTGQSADASSAEFDILRSKAESEQFESELCMQNASLSRPENP